MTPAFPKPTRKFKPHGRVPAESASTSAALRRVATDLCARIIKRRDGGCRFKGLVPDVPCWGPLDAAHIWCKRPRPAVRFMPEAILAACRQHHQWGAANETAWLALCRQLLGARAFDGLEGLSLRTVKLDMVAVVAHLTRRAA